MSNNIKFIISLKIRMNKEEKNVGQDRNNKEETKKLRTLILSTNVNGLRYRRIRRKLRFGHEIPYYFNVYF